MRPLNDREIREGQEKIFKTNKNNSISQIVGDSHAHDGQTFYYDKVFDENSQTQNVYEHIGKEIVKGVR